LHSGEHLSVLGDGERGPFPLPADFPGPQGAAYYACMQRGLAAQVTAAEVPVLAQALQEHRQQAEQRQRQAAAAQRQHGGGWGGSPRASGGTNSAMHAQGSADMEPLAASPPSAFHRSCGSKALLSPTQSRATASPHQRPSQPTSQPQQQQQRGQQALLPGLGTSSQPTPPRSQQLQAGSAAASPAKSAREQQGGQANLRALLAGRSSCDAAPQGAAGTPASPVQPPQQPRAQHGAQQPPAQLAPPLPSLVPLPNAPSQRLVQVFSCMEGQLSPPVLEQRWAVRALLGRGQAEWAGL
jgi:hypothetical protein